jgi:hypothetical protein
MSMGAILSSLCAQWLVYTVHMVYGRELVVQDIGPGIAPLLCGRFYLLKHFVAVIDYIRPCTSAELFHCTTTGDLVGGVTDSRVA